VPSGGAGRSADAVLAATQATLVAPFGRGHARSIGTHRFAWACNEACTWFHLAVDHSGGRWWCLTATPPTTGHSSRWVSASPVVASPHCLKAGAWESRPRSGDLREPPSDEALDGRRQQEEEQGIQPHLWHERSEYQGGHHQDRGDHARVQPGGAAAFLGLQRGPMDKPPVLHEGGQGRDEQGRDVEDVTGLVVCSRRAEQFRREGQEDDAEHPDETGPHENAVVASTVSKSWWCWYQKSAMTTKLSANAKMANPFVSRNFETPASPTLLAASTREGRAGDGDGHHSVAERDHPIESTLKPFRSLGCRRAISGSSRRPPTIIVHVLPVTLPAH